jgi:hypothetical protein
MTVDAEAIMIVARTDSGMDLPGPWERHIMALDDVTRRLGRITGALTAAGVPYALVGGQAVAVWVATKDPAAVRTTKDVDLLLRRGDLPAARAAAMTVDMDYFEVMNVGMFLERDDPNPRHAVRLVWADEKMHADYPLPSASIEECDFIDPSVSVVSLAGLVRMKLMSNRDQDRVHLRDMIDVGLVDRMTCGDLPWQLEDRLNTLLVELGR